MRAWSLLYPTSKSMPNDGQPKGLNRLSDTLPKMAVRDRGSFISEMRTRDCEMWVSNVAYSPYIRKIWSYVASCLAVACRAQTLKKQLWAIQVKDAAAGMFLLSSLVLLHRLQWLQNALSHGLECLWNLVVTDVSFPVSVARQDQKSHKNNMIDFILGCIIGCISIISCIICCVIGCIVGYQWCQFVWWKASLCLFVQLKHDCTTRAKAAN